MELVFATNNRDKLAEVQEILGNRFKIKTLEEIGCMADIPETGTTLEENALQKSTYLWTHYGLSCFADDSGLEISALHGEPGVYSARYSGTRDMERNMDLVLEKLTPDLDRTAQFRTVISLIIGGSNYQFEGSIKGEIGCDRLGEQGFGYDPIFVPSGYDKTFAQMSIREKAAISHRSMAVKKMTDFLKSRFS